VKSTKTLILIIVLLLLIIGLFGSLYLVNQTTVLSGKAASTSSSKIVLQNSYLFVSPLQAQADGLQKIRATVFIIDSQGLGVSNRLVQLKSSPVTLNIQAIQATTDDTGKAVFDLTSTISGKYSLEASVDSTPLPQQVQLLFQ